MTPVLSLKTKKPKKGSRPLRGLLIPYPVLPQVERNRFHAHPSIGKCCAIKSRPRRRHGLGCDTGNPGLSAILCSKSVDENPLIVMPVVLGPTGSGKSELGLRLAQELGGEIVNCDSVQIYRRFQIGTAKVPEAERRGIPHHLIDVVEPAGLFTAGDYAVAAGAALRDIAGRGRIPIVVGGTGFYLRALLDGLSPGPPRDQALREKLQGREQRRVGSLHRILTRLDPAAAARIHRNDRNKTMRALEVRLVEGRPMSELFARGRDSARRLPAHQNRTKSGSRVTLPKLDKRTADMFERGLMDEVRDLLAAGVPPDVKPFESLGYAQALQAVRGLITSEQAIESTQQKTRRYVKRQLTWFRKERDVHWLNGFGEELSVQEQALALARAALEEP